MRHLLHSLFLFLLLAMGRVCLSQDKQLNFEVITNFNGISVGKINAFAQDKYGYLWLSDQTNRCLLRFDGSHLTRYFNDPINANSLGGYYPECLFADSSGNIWIGFWGMGLDKFNPHTNTFTHYRHKEGDPTSLASDSVSAVIIDQQGKIWAGTMGGLSLLDEKSGRFTNYKHDPSNPKSLSWDRVRSVITDRKGDLWVGTGLIWNDSGRGGLNRYNPATNDFTRYQHDPNDPNSLSENSVRCILEDSYGNFWVGTGGDGIQTMDRSTGKFTRYPYDPKRPEKLSRSRPRSEFDNVTFIIEDAARQIWFGTFSGGIVRYDPATKHVQRFDKITVNRNGIIDTTAWAAKALDDGTVWINTEQSNFFKTDVLQSKIPFFSIPNGNVGGSLMEEDHYWVATGSALLRKDNHSGTTAVYPVDSKKPGALGGSPYWLIRDREGVIWTATNTGLYRMNESTGKFELIILDSTSKGQPEVFNVFEDSKGRIWTNGFNTGLYVINRERNHVDQFKHNPQSPSLNGDTPSMLTEIGDQEYMIAMVFNGGINKYNMKTNTWSRYQVGLSCAYLGKDKKGIVWAGTDAGIFRYDAASDQFINLSSDGRISFQGAVIAMTIDDKDNIWVSAGTSLYRISPGRDAVTEFGDYFTTPGAGSFRYVTGNSHKGMIYMACSNGYYYFNPDSLALRQLKSKINLSGFWLNNKQLQVTADGPLNQPLQIIDGLKLGYNQNTFSFSASVINFKFPATTVQYQLEPYDGQWRTAQSEERIQYYNLPSGKYLLKVRSPNLDGSWVSREMSINIAPPWWRSTWAYIAYALLAALGIFGLDRFQRSRIREQERLKLSQRELEQAREIEKAYHQLKATQAQLVQAEKMASLGELTAGIAHEIQNPLNFVNNFSEINRELLDEVKTQKAKVKTEELDDLINDIYQNNEKINHHGKRADAIVKSMLQHSRSSLGVKELTDINALAEEYLRLAYHGLRAKDKSFQSDYFFIPDPTLGKINIVSQDVGRVLLNLINNAFYAVQEKSKAGIDGYKPEVVVSTKFVADQRNQSTSQSVNSLILTVKDNGKGIPELIRQKIFQPFFTTKPAGEGTGLGLSLSYDIIKAHGGEIRVESKEGEGSEFTISIPIV